jgi:hypothetical protein
MLHLGYIQVRNRIETEKYQCDACGAYLTQVNRMSNGSEIRTGLMYIARRICLHYEVYAYTRKHICRYARSVWLLQDVFGPTRKYTVISEVYGYTRNYIAILWCIANSLWYLLHMSTRISLECYSCYPTFRLKWNISILCICSNWKFIHVVDRVLKNIIHNLYFKGNDRCVLG